MRQLVLSILQLLATLFVVSGRQIAEDDRQVMNPTASDLNSTSTEPKMACIYYNEEQELPIDYSVHTENCDHYIVFDNLDDQQTGQPDAHSQNQTEIVETLATNQTSNKPVSKQYFMRSTLSYSIGKFCVFRVLKRMAGEGIVHGTSLLSMESITGSIAILTSSPLY